MSCERKSNERIRESSIMQLDFDDFDDLDEEDVREIESMLSERRAKEEKRAGESETPQPRDDRYHDPGPSTSTQSNQWESDTRTNEISEQKNETGRTQSRPDAKEIEISSGDDNDEFRDALATRCENVVLDVIEQICGGNLPKVSLKKPSIVTLRKKIDDFIKRDVTDDDVNEVDVDELAAEFEELSDNSQFEEPSENSQCDDETECLSQEEMRTIDFGIQRCERKFALLFQTLAKVQQLANDREQQTRRSFYYELKENKNTASLKVTQEEVDAIILDVANLLECSPWTMGLIAAPKGLAFGDLTLRFNDGTKTIFDTVGGTLIPQIFSNVKSVCTRAKLIIVVEKHTVFQMLMEEKIHSLFDCILITGKGYPDVSTRMLVNILAEKLELPVYVLVDADPHGIEILLTYKYGSIKLSREYFNLACPTAQWIGLFPSHFDFLEIQPTALTPSDAKKLESLMKRSYLTQSLIEELTIMKESGKAGIEAMIVGKKNSEAEISFYIWKNIQFYINK